MSQYDSKKTAVALKYDEFNNVAPVVIASGIGYMAEKMVELASEHNVPIFEDSSLSTILSQLDLGAEIPDELYQVVVDIYVYFLHYLPKPDELNR
jgi:flagellar biosynthesis protein